MKIGILGGSFDPIHTGHAVVANELVQRGVFDRVWLVPARINPFKTDEERPADGAMRTEMCRLVADRCKGVEVSDIEQSLPEPSYTYRTLCALSRQYPEHTFRVIIGSDNWEAFGRWRDADRILAEYGVTIYPRPGYELPAELPGNVEVAGEVPQVFVSSTYIRHALKRGEDVTFLVPCNVLNYIEEKQLYR